MPLGSSLMSELGEGFKLPIKRRGLFAKDDFFKGFQQDYSQAVGDVLDRFRTRSSLADRFASYKRLREKDHSEDCQAATVSDTPGSHIIVIDMSDYASGQITVETSGFNAVVNATFGQQKYHRKFPLPHDTIIDGVAADLSDDNILTVTAPRKGKGDGTTGNGQKQTNTSQQSNASSLDQKINTGESIEERIIPTMRENTSTSSISTSSSTRRGSSTRVIPLNLEGESASTQANPCQVEGESSISERVIPTIRESSARGSSSRIIPLNIEGETPASSSSSTSDETTTTQQNLISGVNELNMRSSSTNRVLPIQRRGRFFQDATFENAWREFEHAIDDMVARRGSTAGRGDQDDKFKAYSNLRDVVHEDDTLAATLTKEGNQYKIVMDVKDFIDAHLDVKAINGSVTVIGEKGSKRFERKFSLPGLVKPEDVAAALSTDGVLTITAPL